MKASVILNMAAGSAQAQDQGDLSDRVSAKLADLGWDATVRPASGDDMDEALEAIAPDADVIVVGGGDGTVAGAAAIAIKRDIPLALLPLGTMNVFARDLGLSLDVNAALDALGTEHWRRVDVGYVNDQIFLNSVVLGPFARLARRRERMRDASGAGALYQHLRKAMREFQGYGRQGFQIDDGKTKRALRVGTIQVTNNPLSASLMPVPERHSLSEGVLGCYVDHSRTRVGFAKASVQAVLGGMSADPTNTSFTSDKIVITPKRPAIPASVDGEMHMIKGPLTFRVANGALKILGGA